MADLSSPPLSRALMSAVRHLCGTAYSPPVTLRLPAPFSLQGRTALVTGAGSPDGIGFAVARLLGELGAAVALAATMERAHERAGELRAGGVRALGVVGDLTEPAAVRTLVNQVAAELGAPTVLVNNAGMTSVATPDAAGESGTILDLTPGTWQRAIARNLDTAYLATRAA